MFLFLRLLSVVVVSILLGACSKVGGNAVTKGHPVKTPYTLPAEAYMSLAENQSGEEKSALIIMAAGRATFDGEWRKARAWLKTLPALPPILNAQKRILLAKIQLVQHHPKEAIGLLSQIHVVNQLATFYQVQFHEILATAYDATGRLQEAIGERMLLNKMLPSEEEKVRNQRLMWLTLTRLPEAELNTMIAEWGESPELEGWLKLALIEKTASANPVKLTSQLQAWVENYPQHPALSLLPMDLINHPGALLAAPKRIALLLPTSGPLAGPGRAVHEGFMAAMQQSPLPEAPSVHVYDTATTPTKRLYEQAISEGADFVIGPLSKGSVAEVMHLTQPVPTLLLNESDRRAEANTFFLTLSPSNEARQVAMKARQEGYRQALIIAPEGKWGEEVMASFSSQFQGIGGKVVDVYRYGKDTPLNAALREFMQYEEPDPKDKSKAKGEEEQTMPSRREDFDMIFLVAYPSKAREIMPILRYYYLGNTQVFATSAIYSGSKNPKQDKDLDGIIFCDMPYVFTHDLPNKHWPEQLNSYTRLYALGRDSYEVATHLNALRLFPALGLNDKSGVLYLTADHQVDRLLAWGQFERGNATLISNPIQ